ncbi:MAG TPA: 3-deoxy-manno-octulosonate cytidylyltransferase [Planctomycetota bacterium]|nr:3-deoxy-manno-octulosonate cytidylyltransferase [Planctomycetota bacterium]HRR79168.1 3-deoxy-manno-octulosonate cytidylyltransferase [Planctomycetota bacterium]HRT93967.1 3-deoxy-manno-octulosonate cytidylyltransferase [Planctomycetota bacterium]
MAKVVVAIPARYPSTRLPGKPLLRETGRFLIQHVYEQVSLAPCVDDVVVATDDERIRAAVESFGGRALMTSPGHRSGTDRIAEAARHVEADIIVNVQGDEPEIEPDAIDLAVALLERHPGADMSTLAAPIAEPDHLRNPNLVKVVLDTQGYALYFSRALLPASKSYPEVPPGDPHTYLGHIGLYAYRRDFLFRFASLPPSPLETHESLEQLRALEHGHRIIVGITSYQPKGIDTPDDYQAFLRRWRSRRQP